MALEGRRHPLLALESPNDPEGELYSIVAFDEGAFAALILTSSQTAQMEEAAARAEEVRVIAEAERVRSENERKARAAYRQAVEAEKPSDLCQRRGIQQLVHFTRLSNLASILTHGLYPRCMHPKLSVRPQLNDMERFDGLVDATSFSISHPNEQLFDLWRNRKYWSDDWVVLLASPCLLWERRCDLFYKNASALPVPCT